MQIPDLSVDLGPTVSGRSANAPDRAPDGFIEALDALLGDIDEMTMALAAAGAVPMAAAMTAPPPAAGTLTEAAAAHALAALAAGRGTSGLPGPAGATVDLPAVDAGATALQIEVPAPDEADAVAVADGLAVADGTAPMADTSAPDADVVTRPDGDVVTRPDGDVVSMPAASDGPPPGGDVPEPPAATPAAAQAGTVEGDGAGDRSDDPGDSARAGERAPTAEPVGAAPATPADQVEEARTPAATPVDLDPAATGGTPSGDRAGVAPGGAATVATQRSGPPTAPTAPTHVDRALVDAVRQLREGREESRHLVLQLDPPELGSVNVRLVVRGEEIQLTMHSANGDARTALGDQRSSIEDAFAASGLELRDFDITGGEPERREQEHQRPSGAGPSADASLVEATEDDGALRL